jgi:hypothetical protein
MIAGLLVCILVAILLGYRAFRQGVALALIMLTLLWACSRDERPSRRASLKDHRR